MSVPWRGMLHHPCQPTRSLKAASSGEHHTDLAGGRFFSSSHAKPRLWKRAAHVRGETLFMLNCPSAITTSAVDHHRKRKRKNGKQENSQGCSLKCLLRRKSYRIFQYTDPQQFLHTPIFLCSLSLPTPSIRFRHSRSRCPASPHTRHQHRSITWRAHNQPKSIHNLLRLGLLWREPPRPAPPRIHKEAETQ